MAKQMTKVEPLTKQKRGMASRAACSFVTLSMLSVSLNTMTEAPVFAARRIASATGISQNQPATQQPQGSGTLMAMLPSGKQIGQCPLTHTEVTADVSGYISHVKVKQVFANTNKEAIEAIYTFPLSNTGAVDEMVMQIGSRRIQGSIKKRAEAREIYNNAKAHGHTASLLDQERTNIFTQSVANIPAGAKVEVTLQYVETLPFEDGKFSFVFPTVVGPRFIPGTVTDHTGTGRIDNTAQVPDASLITPPVAAEGSRSGHDISIKVSINGGVPISNINSKLHEIKVDKNGQDKAVISLIDKNTIANKDFVLNWDVAGASLKSGYLTHRDKSDRSGYFTLMVMPPKRPTVAEIAPRELIFLIDCSGSQSGLPLQKAKETLSYIIEHMNQHDTFQIIAFNNGNTNLFEKPQAVSKEMKDRAQTFINGLEARGGTYCAPAVEAACAIPADEHRLRIVTFMTDGFVGNDMEIVGMIRKLRGTSRWFTFGTGNSVNRALIDGMALEGGGEPDYVLLNSSGAEVGKKFYQHISSPILTDVKVDFGSLKVKDVSPREVFDVWAQRPLYFKGRYEEAGSSTVTLTGYAAGKPYKQTLNVALPETNEKNSALGSIWARAQVDKLMREDLIGAQRGAMKKELQDEVTDIALKHHIMTQFTSFVAVDESSKVTPGNKTIVVPTDMADGVSRLETVAGNAVGSKGLVMPMQSRSVQSYGAYGGGGAPAAAPMARMNAPRGMRFDYAANGVLKQALADKLEPAAVAQSTPAVLDSRRAESAQLEKSKVDAKEINLPKDQSSSKFDLPLQNLLKIRSNNNQLSRKILVSIKFRGDETALLKALKMLGFTKEGATKQNQFMLGKISGDQLAKIAQLTEVVEISLCEHVQN
ncbi:MAG: VIT and VWA domain-containing protein [Candidatus Obscuribacterales bacterium]|nr:VIT and VWA domain-containing protein [Candidatus Obscuribacterales bacterium]